MAGQMGTGSVNTPSRLDWFGSSLAEYGGQPRRRITFHANDGSSTQIGADMHGNLVRHRPRTQDDVEIYVNGVLLTWGTTAEPRGVRFVTEDKWRGTNLEIILDASVAAGDVVTMKYTQ